MFHFRYLPSPEKQIKTIHFQSLEELKFFLAFKVNFWMLNFASNSMFAQQIQYYASHDRLGHWILLIPKNLQLSFCKVELTSNIFCSFKNSDHLPKLKLT
uniref:Uncharacterized protein n=1 Tax=Micrurus spixii TaxID=129469 RepID=A0A2D4MPP5_9SAUR